MQVAKPKIILSAAAIGIALFAMLLAIRTWNYLRQPIPSLPKPIEAEEPDRFYLRTGSLSDDAKVHLLDDKFETVKKWNEIPSSCITIFESSFVTLSGSHAKPGEIPLANPREAFQASDNIVPGLAFRRLEFGSFSATKCFIHYQYGGQPSSFCLAVVDYVSQKTVWAGESAKAARNLDDLRLMLLRRQFRDTARPAPTC